MKKSFLEKEKGTPGLRPAFPALTEKAKESYHE